LGAALCGSGGDDGGVAFFLGKMDFWSQTHGYNATYTTPRHLATHVAAGSVSLAVTAAGEGAAPAGWSCSVFNCTCAGMAGWYGVLAGVGFGCAPPAAQAWWTARRCAARASCGCCKGPGCALPGAAACGCGHHPPPPPGPPHPAPGPPSPGPAIFHATQVLETARVNASITAAHGQQQGPTLNLSAIVVAEANVLLVRLSVDRPAVLGLTLAAGNTMDLPLSPGRTATALTLQRSANAWLDNAAVLLECDAGMSPSYALRGLVVDTTSGRIRFVNASAPGQHTCPLVISHPIYGPATVGSRLCSPAPGGPDDWRFNAATGTVRRAPQPSPSAGCVEMAYNTSGGTSFVLFSRACAGGAAGDPGETSNEFRVVQLPASGGGELPEGGTAMLKAVRMSNKTAPGGANTRWIADGGCVAVVKPNLNISMGLAAWVFDGAGRPLPAAPAPNGGGAAADEGLQGYTPTHAQSTPSATSRHVH